MAKRREWNLQQQSRQIQQQIRHGESPQAAVSDTLGGSGGGAAMLHGEDATTLGTGGADVHAGGGTAAGVAAVAGAEGAVTGGGGASVGRAGEAGEIDNQDFTQMRAGGVAAIGAAGGDTIQGGPAGARASGSAMAARLVHRARGFATEVSDMLFRGVKKR